MATPDRREFFWDLVRSSAVAGSIELIAWVILEEHYHLIISPAVSQTVDEWIGAIHSRSSLEWNREDATPGRQGWYQYWDRSLWPDGDLWSRINYIHGNPVKHGYVAAPENWEWSSYSSFQEIDEPEIQMLRDRFRAPRNLPGDDF